MSIIIRLYRLTEDCAIFIHLRVSSCLSNLNRGHASFLEFSLFSLEFNTFAFPNTTTTIRDQVFGMDKKYWFIPAYSEDDKRRMPALQGLEYPSKPESDAQPF